MGPVASCRPRRRGERTGHWRLPQRPRAGGRPRPAVPRRLAQPADQRRYRTARPAGAAYRHRLQDPGRGPDRRRRPAALRRRIRSPADQRRRPRGRLRAHRQRGPRAAAARTQRRTRRLIHGRDEPRLRDRRQAAGGVRGRAAAAVRPRAAAAALSLHGRQGPRRVDDRHRAHRPRGAARVGAPRLPAVQRLPPHGLPEAPLRPGQDRDRGRSRAAAAHPRAERHLPGRRVRGGGPELRIVRPVPDLWPRGQRGHAGRTAPGTARRPGPAGTRLVSSCRVSSLRSRGGVSPCGGAGRGGACGAR
jgi:hypothetical protein